MSAENDFVKIELRNEVLSFTVLVERTPTEDEWRTCKDAMAAMYVNAAMKGTKISLFLDLRNLGVLPLHLYDEWARFFFEKSEESAQCVLCSAVLTNTLLQQGMTFFLEQHPAPSPIAFFSSTAPAMEFIRNHVAKKQSLRI